MNKIERIYKMPVSNVYPHYISKAIRKGRTKEEVDALIFWLTGYQKDELERILEEQVDFETFFKDAPFLNPNRHLITGVICGIRVETMDPSLMQEIRYLDKIIDELSKGKSIDRIKRES